MTAWEAWGACEAYEAYGAYEACEKFVRRDDVGVVGSV